MSDGLHIYVNIGDMLDRYYIISLLSDKGLSDWFLNVNKWSLNAFLKELEWAEFVEKRKLRGFAESNIDLRR